MQTANIEVALGNDKGNTVPKTGVTAAEIAVLSAIHGNDAVFNIQPTGTIPRPNREELARLKEIYGKAKNGENQSIVGLLFPGVAARVYENIDELGLVPEQFAATGRVSAPAPQLVDADVVPDDIEPEADAEPELEAEAVVEDEPEEVPAAKPAKTPKVKKESKKELFA